MKGVQKKIRALSRLMTASMLVLPLSSPAFAQPQAGKDEASAIGEIVVTATKRTERLQDVPIAVQAVTGDLLKSGAVQNFDAMKTANELDPPAPQLNPCAKCGEQPSTDGIHAWCPDCRYKLSNVESWNAANPIAEKVERFKVDLLSPSNMRKRLF